MEAIGREEIQMRATNHTKPVCGSKEGETTKRSVDAALGCIVVLLNIVEIIMIARLKRKKRIYEILLLSLSSSDMLFGLSNIFISIIYITGNCKSDEIFNVIHSFYLFSVITSMCHLSWIAIDRLWAVSSPFRHNAVVTRKKLYALIACTWFIAFSIALTLNLIEEFTETFGRKGDTEMVRNSVSTTATTTTVFQAADMRGTRRPIRGGGPSPPNRNGGRLPPSPPKDKRRLSKENYKEKIQLAIAILLILADALFVFTYGAMVYILDTKIKYTKIQVKKEDRISVVCIAIAATFVVLTMPYSFSVFITGKSRFEINILLIINGGLNSIIYFFRAKCEKYVERKYKTVDTADSSNSTAITTSANSTPQLMLKTR